MKSVSAQSCLITLIKFFNRGDFSLLGGGQATDRCPLSLSSQIIGSLHAIGNGPSLNGLRLDSLG